MTDTRAGKGICAFAVLALAVAVTPERAGAQDATAVLAKARAAYAQAGSFHETLELELTLPDGSVGARRQDYGVGSDGGAFFRLAADGRDGLRIVAAGDRAVVVWAHIAERYAETAYAGDFAAALDALEAPQVQLAVPPAVVAAQGGDAAAFLDALRFGILAPLEPVAVRQARSAAGEAIVEVELRATNGTATIGIDEASGRLATMNIALGEGDRQVRAAGTFTFATGEPTAELALPDVSGRASVATITALEASKYPLGEPAAAIVVPALDGTPVDLGALAGHVVVLDFWATWCVPCWAALEHTETLTAWAKSSGLPVKVFAVDSLERTDDLEAQRRLAKGFLTTKDLQLDVLVDFGNHAFAAFHNPGLPSLVIVDPRGRLSDYHSGVLDDMAEVVKARILELLEAAGE